MFIINPNSVSANNIKAKFLKLALPQKLIGAGAIIALVSAVLPWYSDIDMYNTGERFLGVTGPLYLVGYIIIALSLFSIILTGFYLMNKKIPALPMKEPLVYILTGVVSLSLLIIANSVYFHPEFGVNITSKEYGIGMMLALIGAMAVLIGGIMLQRESGTPRLVKEFQEETIDPVLELNNFQKEQQMIHEKAEIESEIPSAPPKKTSAEERFEGHTGVREYKAKSEATAPISKGRAEPYPDPSLLKKESAGPVASSSPAETSKEEGVNPNTVIRMDL